MSAASSPASGPASSGASTGPSTAPSSAVASVAASTPALRAEGLVKHFPVRTGLFGRAAAHVRAVDGVSFEVAAGQTFAIVGESGCGKSTVARLLLRLIEPDAGRVRLGDDDLLAAEGAALRRLRGRIQLVFQDPYGSLNPRMTAGDALAEPLLLHGGGGDAASRAARVGELLAQVGLRPEAARRYPHEFSGGQRQRLAIARALAAGPQVIVCDEPVSALDVSIQAQILNLLGELQRRLGLAYVFISHDLAVVRQVATGLGVMYLGRFVETGPAAAVFDAPKHPYTRALLAAVPVPDPAAAKARDPAIGGDVPSPLAPPPGCTFHTRCPHADARCRAEVPTLEPAGDGTSVACWHWRTIPPPASTRAVRRTPDDALARLQAAFAK